MPFISCSDDLHLSDMAASLSRPSHLRGVPQITIHGEIYCVILQTQTVLFGSYNVTLLRGSVWFWSVQACSKPHQQVCRISTTKLRQNHATLRCSCPSETLKEDFRQSARFENMPTFNVYFLFFLIKKHMRHNVSLHCD